MTGLHINWSTPHTTDNGEYVAEDFELLTTIISALKWKEKNGRIKLCADRNVIDLYSKIGIIDIYDEVEALEIEKSINPKMFWAGAKIFALQKQQAPVAVIDNDFIVWDTIPFDELGDCTVIHFEDLYPDVYPSPDYFKFNNNYKLPDFNFNLPACNTAFYVLKSQKLLDYYTQTAIDFMQNSIDAPDTLKYMVFAEQRLISLCADKLKIKVNAFFELEELFKSNNNFTHIWGMKQQMRDNDILRKNFCNKCLIRINKDFPEYSKIAKKITLI